MVSNVRINNIKQYEIRHHGQNYPNEIKSIYMKIYVQNPV